MKDRTNEEGIDPVTDAPAENAGRRGMDESRNGEKNGDPQERTMIEEILEPENLAEAWKRVRANKGAPGIDGMTIEDFPAFARGHWPRIATAIREGNYRPAPVRRVWISKPDGSKRPLGIPTVLDRVIQQAIAQVLGPIFEVGFSDHSYGFRPGRSARLQIDQARLPRHLQLSPSRLNSQKRQPKTQTVPLMPRLPKRWEVAKNLPSRPARRCPQRD